MRNHSQSFSQRPQTKKFCGGAGRHRQQIRESQAGVSGSKKEKAPEIEPCQKGH